MKAEIKQGAMLVAMNYLQHFAVKDSDLVKITISGGGMVFEVGDGLFVGQYSVSVDAVKSIATALPIKILAGIARETSAPLIQFDLHEQKPCSITAGGAHYRVNPSGLPRPTERPQYRSVVDCDGLLLLRACRLVSHAVAKGDVRATALKGLLIDMSVERFSVVGCDGRRLSTLEKRRKARQEGEPELPTGKSLVHREHIGALLAAMESENPTVSLRFTDHSMEILSGRRWGSFPLVDGQYPQWRKSIIRELRSASPEYMHCVAGPLKMAIRQLEIFSEVADSDACVLSQSNGRAYLECADNETGEARVELPATEVGQFEPVVFNAKLIREAISNLDYEEKIRWEIRRRDTPIVITAGRYRTLVMPLSPAEKCPSDLSERNDAVSV